MFSNENQQGKRVAMMVIPKPGCTDFYLIPPKSLSFLLSQISLFLKPIPFARKKKIKIKIKATEPEPNPYLFRKEDDEIGAAVGEERQDFEAWIL